MKSDRYDSAS